MQNINQSMTLHTTQISVGLHNQYRWNFWVSLFKGFSQLRNNTKHWENKGGGVSGNCEACFGIPECGSIPYDWFILIVILLIAIELQYVVMRNAIWFWSETFQKVSHFWVGQSSLIFFLTACILVVESGCLRHVIFQLTLSVPASSVSTQLPNLYLINRLILHSRGIARSFQRGRSHGVKEDTHQIFMSFSPPAVGCLLKKV